MNVVAIIQARMGSTRLPGKVLMDLDGETALGRVVRRLRRSTRIQQIMIATTTKPEDDAIISACRQLGCPAFRGSSEDVLDRYYQASRMIGCEVIVRVTADCPLIDPDLVDRSIDLLGNEGADYVATDVPGTFPRGTDVEVFTAAAMARSWRESAQAYEREHVTPFFYEHPDLFRLATLKSGLDCRRYRWTLDTFDDYRVLGEICREFRNDDAFSWHQVVGLMERRPELLEWNAHVAQKPLK